MKKVPHLKRKILIVALVVFLITGVYFCQKRPEYVKEAVDILFQNELTESNIEKYVDDKNPEEETSDFSEGENP